jgi:hypothetical protein
MEATFPLPPLPATRGATFDCGVHYKHKKLNPFATSPPGCFQGKGGGSRPAGTGFFLSWFLGWVLIHVHPLNAL